MESYNQIQTSMKWIHETWEYDTMGRDPKVGVFGWSMSYGIDRRNAVEDYIDDYPDDFDYAGAKMAPYGTSSWTSEVEALKDCDYIIVGAFAGGAATFIGTMRTAGHTDPVFVMNGNDLGFMSVYVVNPGKKAIDGTIWAADQGYYKTDFDWMSEWTRDLLDNYFDDADSNQVEAIKRGECNAVSTMAACLLVPIEILAEAIEGLEDPADVTGEMIYDVATTYTMSYEGYPDVAFSATKRVLFIYMKMYEYSATANDWHPVSDWITAPGYE